MSRAEDILKICEEKAESGWAKGEPVVGGTRELAAKQCPVCKGSELICPFCEKGQTPEGYGDCVVCSAKGFLSCTTCKPDKSKK